MSQTNRLSAQLLALGAALMLLAGCSSTSNPPTSASSGTAATTSSASATVTSTATGTATSSPKTSATTTQTSSSKPSGTTSGPTTSSTATAVDAAVCTAASSLGRALTSLKDSLRNGATVDQVRAARDQVLNSYNDLAAAIGNVAKARLEAVKSAADRFAAAVNDIPDDATLNQALDSLSQEAKDVQAALADLLTEIRC
ncbi:hypothetical protein ACETK3_11550 [Arthrobacter sp. E44]|uniref:hypothetical protein n=1 Tax=Arthrobacter sp. E44 TaxID=3341794 RepID=UPI0035A6E3B9